MQSADEEEDADGDQRMPLVEKDEPKIWLSDSDPAPNEQFGPTTLTSDAYNIVIVIRVVLDKRIIFGI